MNWLTLFLMSRKGYYIKKGIKDQSIYLYINKVDFINYLNDTGMNEWVKFRIYERDNVDLKGFTHNMELIQSLINNEGNSKNIISE